MNLFIKQHSTEKIPTSKGTFLGLPKSQSTRNLEVGDYFCIFSEKEDLLIFIQKEPLKRTYPKFVDPEPIKPLTSEQLKEIGL